MIRATGAWTALSAAQVPVARLLHQSASASSALLRSAQHRNARSVARHASLNPLGNHAL